MWEANGWRWKQGAVTAISHSPVSEILISEAQGLPSWHPAFLWGQLCALCWTNALILYRGLSLPSLFPKSKGFSKTLLSWATKRKSKYWFLKVRTNHLAYVVSFWYPFITKNPMSVFAQTKEPSLLERIDQRLSEVYIDHLSILENAIHHYQDKMSKWSSPGDSIMTEGQMGGLILRWSEDKQLPY